MCCAWYGFNHVRVTKVHRQLDNGSLVACYWFRRVSESASLEEDDNYLADNHRLDGYQPSNWWSFVPSPQHILISSELEAVMRANGTSASSSCPHCLGNPRLEPMDKNEQLLDQGSR